MRLLTQKTRTLLRFVTNERGTQLVEIAIVLPVMLLLLAAIGEFGRFIHAYSTLSKATRTGARYLSAKSASEITSTQNLVVCGKTSACSSGEEILTGLGTSNVSITTEGGSPTCPERITVSITGYTYQPVFSLPAMGGVSLAIDVAPSTTIRYLMAPC